MTQTIIPYPEVQKNAYKLLALADHIEKIPEELFSMHTYRRNGNSTLRGCGTVGCILGHAPSLLVQRFHVKPTTITYQYPRDKEEIDWDKVSAQFGIAPYANNGRSQRTELWAYLFAGAWVNSDGSPTGAAARIRWVVKYGGVPTDWSQQVQGISRDWSYVVDPPGTSAEVWKYLKEQRQGTKQHVEEKQS